MFLVAYSILNFDSEHDVNLFAPIWDFIYKSEKGMGQYLIDQRYSPRYRQRYAGMRMEDELQDTFL